MNYHYYDNPSTIQFLSSLLWVFSLNSFLLSLSYLLPLQQEPVIVLLCLLLSGVSFATCVSAAAANNPTAPPCTAIMGNKVPLQR